MAKRVVGWLGLVVVCGVLGGCKSADQEEAAAISREELPAAIASVLCDSLRDCCSAAKFVFDSASCAAGVSARLDAYLDQRTTAAVSYDARAAGDCLAQLEQTVRCGRTEGAENEGACRRMLSGTLAEGQPCSLTPECAEPGICSQDFATRESTCVHETIRTLVHGREGDACSMTCDDEDACSYPELPGDTSGEPTEPTAPRVGCYIEDSLVCIETCQRLKDVGEPCAGAGGCKDFCDRESMVCAAPRQNGAACREGFECQSGSCRLAGGESEGICVEDFVTGIVTEHACVTSMP
jgi:hypothetical protein